MFSAFCMIFEKFYEPKTTYYRYSYYGTVLISILAPKYRFPWRYVPTWMQSSSTYASLRIFLSTDQTWIEELTTSLFRPQKMELRLIDAAWLSNLLVGLLCSLKYYSNKENIHNTYYTIIWRDFLTSQEILSILLISSLGLKKI